MLVGVAAAPADAATGCDAPDTTWVGPAEGGSASWAEPSNWTAGVPAASSSVCIPDTTTGPRVLEGTSAEARAVTLEGTLNVDGSLGVGTLEGDFGELHGTGITTVTGGLTGTGLTLEDAAEVDLLDGAVLDGDVGPGSGLLKVVGDVVLGSARIDSLGGRPFTIAEGGSLTLDDPIASAHVTGGFANHGAVTVAAGHVLMMGASPEDAHSDQFSTGTFTGSPEAFFNVSNTELRTGASLEHVTYVDHITVPSGSTATIADSTLIDNAGDLGPSTVTGAGHLLLTDGSIADAHIGGSLAVRIPAGEVASTGDAVVQDQARIRVDGELRGGNITLNDDAVLDVFGVHRGAAPSAGSWNAIAASRDDPGVEIIHPTGRLVSDADSGVLMAAPFVNYGTVDSGTGFIYLGPEAESPSASSGTFRADPAGDLWLGEPGGPEMVLDLAAVEGDVEVAGDVRANNSRIDGDLSTRPGGDTYPPGRLELTGTTTIANGASVAGEVLVGGRLEADLGAMGTATLSGAEVTGSVEAVSGTLSVPSLGPTTLTEEGTLTQGRWDAWPGATLDLPAVTTNDAFLDLMGPGASFGDGLSTLTVNGPNGNLFLGGADLAVVRWFRNEGLLGLGSGSRLDVGGKFRQLPTGHLVTSLDETGRGRVRAAGPRDLAGALWIDRDPAYKPPVGTVLNFITSAGAKSADDAFDKVSSPRYGTTRKLQPTYDTNHVRLRVDRVG
jgi:hypothetical protein